MLPSCLRSVATVPKLQLLQSICLETHQSTTLHPGKAFECKYSTEILENHIYCTRAGANFSAISGGDANALRWDKLGYGQMMKLAEEHGIEACISKTPSIEYWDEMPSRTKIDSMAEYLKDVSNYHSKKQHVLVELENLTPP
jgi:hypothetical protein